MYLLLIPVCLLLCLVSLKESLVRAVSEGEQWKLKCELERAEHVTSDCRRHSLFLSKQFRGRRAEVVMTLGRYPATTQQQDFRA